MMDAIVQHGQAIAFAAFNTRNFQPLAAIVKDAVSEDVNRREAGRQAYTSAIIQLARFLEAARTKGFRFSPEPPVVTTLVYRAAVSESHFWNDSLLILSTTLELLRVSPGILASEGSTAAPVAAIKPEAPSPTAPAQPIEVRVVSMVTRKTVTEIDHNLAGDIVSAMQIESDF